jgi:hypothetical protein
MKDTRPIKAAPNTAAKTVENASCASPKTESPSICANPNFSRPAGSIRYLSITPSNTVPTMAPARALPVTIPHKSMGRTFISLWTPVAVDTYGKAYNDRVYPRVAVLHLFTSCRERKFSETPSQDRATLCVRTGAKHLFAPVEYPRSRHLATPSHKNSLGRPPNRSDRGYAELPRRPPLGGWANSPVHPLIGPGLRGFRDD